MIKPNKPLATRHVIIFTADINKPSVDLLIDTLVKIIEHKPSSIILLLSSAGGDPACGLVAYNFLKNVQIPIHIWNIGSVCSTANIIYMAGSERYAQETSSFMLHPFSLNITKVQDIEHSKLSEYVRQLESNLSLLINILTTNVTTNINWRTEIMNTRVFSAQEAVGIGYCSAILPFNIGSSDRVYRI